MLRTLGCVKIIHTTNKINSNTLPRESHSMATVTLKYSLKNIKTKISEANDTRVLTPCGIPETPS